MFKVKLQFSKFLALMLVVCLTCFTVSVTNSQQLPLDAAQSKISAQETAKSKLASELLSDIGIAKRYDMHFDHLMGTLIVKDNESKLYARFRKMFVREIGWKHFKDAYAARLAADFSEDELKELLKLSKQPVMKKLLQSEVKAYTTDTSKQRFKIGFKLWDEYNSGKISLPPD
jgi:Ca2+-binding EF-hand superfamily protein